MNLETFMKLAQICDAIYICPKDENGKRLGPLVVYAGKDKEGRNLVGDIYFNFRKIEQNPIVVKEFAEAILPKLTTKHKLSNHCQTFCGIPNGGRTLGQELARLNNSRFVYPEKKPKPTQPGKKQEYDWDISQFEFEPGEQVVIVEDVFNNFQNTDHTLEAIASTGAEIVALAGALNRSPIYDDFYTPKKGACAGRQIPIFASIREAYPEYEQDDPEVASDIKAGNLELEVKKNWAGLRALMQQPQTH